MQIKEILEELMSDEKTCWFLIGIPAVGKSSLIKEITSIKDMPVLSRDNIVEELAQELGMKYRAVFADPELDIEVNSRFEKRKVELEKTSFIWDQMNISGVKRAGAFKNLRNRGFKINAIWLDTPMEVLMERYIHRKIYTDKDVSMYKINTMVETMNRPTINEDVDNFLIINQNGCYLNPTNYEHNVLNFSKGVFLEYLKNHPLKKEFDEAYSMKQKEFNKFVAEVKARKAKP